MSNVPQEYLDDIMDNALEECFPDVTKSISVVEKSASSDDEEDTEDATLPEIPKEFANLMNDFINDIVTTFPEYNSIIKKWWGFDSYTGNQLVSLFSHCLKIYPPRFTDIIYKNIDIFDASSDTNVEFLPGISFKYLWSCADITEQTRDVIWKYLQTITLCVVGSVDNTNMDKSMKEVFDNLDETNFKDSLCDTINDIQQIFGSAMKNDTEGNIPESSPDSNSSLPNISADTFQDNLNSMVGGKIGALAEDIMKDTLQNFNESDFAGAESPADILKKLCEKPGSLISMAQSVSAKLKEKMDSGEYNQNDLFKEATDVLQNMKDIPGMEMMQNLMSGMARNAGNMGGMGTEEGGDAPDMGNMANMMEMMMGGLAKGQRIDTNAMNRQTKRKNQITEMKKRIEKKNAQDITQLTHQMQQAASRTSVPALSDDELMELFEHDEKQHTSSSSIANKNKKSGNKK